MPSPRPVGLRVALVVAAMLGQVTNAAAQVEATPEPRIMAPVEQDLSNYLEGPYALLLEAGDGTAAVPFSGTALWSTGVDELGKPAIKAEVEIPARNLRFEFVLKSNSDPSLPASHLVELSFGVPDSFVGGSIASVPGLLLKNEELVPGKPLVGASARVVANMFLFALSASPEDLTNNYALLDSQGYLDIALVYGSGKRALLTLRRDAKALAQFADVHAAWNALAAAGSAPVAPAGPYVQLSANRTRADAEERLASVRAGLAAIVNPDSLQIIEVNLGARGIVHRVITRTASFQEAVSLCADIKAAGTECIPVN